MIVRNRVRLLMMCMAIVGLMAGTTDFSSQRVRADDPNQVFSASGFKIHQAGPGPWVGGYSLPEPPGYGPVICDGTSGTPGSVWIYPTGYITVQGLPMWFDETVKITEIVYQRLANGSLKEVANGNTVSVTANSQHPVYVPLQEALTVPLGPDYVLAYTIMFMEGQTNNIYSSVTVGYQSYGRRIDGVNLSDSSVCGNLKPPAVTVNATSGAVNSVLTSTIKYYPHNVVVPITWDGTSIGGISTGYSTYGSGSVNVPAAPMGPHTVEWNYGHWKSKITYTVKPRIKLTPGTVSRGQTVNVSLRGYAKYETVNIRWKKGTSWVQVGQVKTSGNGSANINIKVPAWAPLGANSVRGDGSYGRAQTNAVTVSGAAAMTSSSVKSPAAAVTATKTATATPTKTTTPVVTSTPSPQATTVPVTPSATATAPVETPTPEETALPETATPEASSTLTPLPTGTPAATSTPEPTATAPADPTPTPSDET